MADNEGLDEEIYILAKKEETNRSQKMWAVLLDVFLLPGMRSRWSKDCLGGIRMRDEFDDLEEFDLDGDGMLDEFEIVLAEEERPTESDDDDDDDWDDDDF